MTPERLHALVDAYGVDAARWPAAERAAAQALAAEAGAHNVLQAAAQLDDWLAGHRVAAAQADLQARILAAAPPPRGSRRPWQAWLPSIGLAGAGMAGIAAGVLTVSLFAAVPPPAPASAADWPYASMAFGGPSQIGSDE